MAASEKLFQSGSYSPNVESRTKGTMILRYSGRFYKVIKARSRGDNIYTFECKDLDTKQNKILNFNANTNLISLGSAQGNLNHIGAGGGI
jgi:hypothetical protein